MTYVDDGVIYSDKEILLGLREYGHLPYGQRLAAHHRRLEQLLEQGLLHAFTSHQLGGGLVYVEAAKVGLLKRANHWIVGKALSIDEVRWYHKRFEKLATAPMN